MSQVPKLLTKSELLKFQIFQGRPSRFVFSGKCFLLTAALKAPSYDLAHDICKFPYYSHIAIMRNLRQEGTTVSCRICFTKNTLEVQAFYAEAIKKAYDCDAYLDSNGGIKVQNISVDKLREIFTRRHTAILSRYLKGSPVTFMQELADATQKTVALKDLFSPAALTELHLFNKSKPAPEDEDDDEAEWDDEDEGFSAAEIEMMKTRLLEEEMLSEKMAKRISDADVVELYRELLDGISEEDYDEDEDEDEDFDRDEIIEELAALRIKGLTRSKLKKMNDDELEDLADEHLGDGWDEDEEGELLKERKRHYFDLKKRAIKAGAHKDDLPGFGHSSWEDILLDIIDACKEEVKEEVVEDDDEDELSVSDARRQLLEDGWPAEKLAIIDDEAVTSIFNQLY